MVLVGGQAINVWANLYLPRIEALRAEGPFTSKDVDFLGDKGAVKECARRLNLGKAIFDDPFAREAPVNSGIVQYVDDAGVERTIDFLSTVLGVNERDIRKTAPRVDIGGQPISVMHPVLCIQGRGPLILQLGRRDEHTLKQLRAAILCAREFLADLVSAQKAREVYGWNEHIFSYARSRQGIEIYKKYRIDVFKAVLVDDRLDEKFRRLRYPQMREQVQSKRRNLDRDR
jgi:hypothetical protein